MNKYPNTTAAQRKVIIRSNPQKLHGSRQYDVVEELYEEVDVQYDTAIVEFEVLSDVMRVESPSDLNDEMNIVDQPTNAKPAQWSRPAIFYLIATYKGLARNETSGKTCFGPTVIWTEVSKKLQKRGFTCTPEQCRTKWMLLKKLYQHIRTELQIEKFEFLETMHEYYKNPRIEKLLFETKKTPKQSTLRTKTKRKRSADGEVGSKDRLQINEIEFQHKDESLQTSDDFECTTSFQYLSESEETQRTAEFSEDTSNDPHFLGSLETSANILTAFREIIAEQEQRREERHKAKLKIFREYNDRLLAQQEQAIIMHKELMNRLIDNL